MQGADVLLEVEDFLASHDVPQPDQTVLADAHDATAMWMISERQNLARSAFELKPQLALGGVPDADRLVAAGRDERQTVGAEGDGVDMAGMAFELVGLVILQVPEEGLLALAPPAGGEPAAIGAEGQAENAVWRIQRLDELALRRIPQANGVVLAGAGN